MAIIEYSYEDGDMYFLDVCDVKGHTFFDEGSGLLESGDIKKKCFVCEDIITFYHYTKAEMKKEMMNLNNLPN